MRHFNYSPSVTRTLFAFSFTIFILNFGVAQTPQEQIYGPHDKYDGPYFVRTFVTFVENSNNWTNGVDLHERVNNILDNLNTTFNRYQIYFIGNSNPCELSYNIVNDPGSYSDLPNNALDIYDEGDETDPNGNAYNIPSTYLRISGQDASGPAILNGIMFHEIGHCLGLSHLFTGLPELHGEGYMNDCFEGSPPIDCETEAAYCCGDYVKDTQSCLRIMKL